MNALRRVISMLVKILGACLAIGLLVLAIKFFRVDQSAKADGSSGNTGAAAGGYPAPTQFAQLTLGALANQAYPAPKATVTPISKMDAFLTSQPPWLTATPAQIGNDGWYIFSDTEVGYSFHYPKDATLTSAKTKRDKFQTVTLEFRVPNATSYHGIVIQVELNTDLQAPLYFASKVAASYGTQASLSTEAIANSSTYLIAKMPALKITIPQTQSDFMLFLPYKDKLLTISSDGNPMVMVDPVKNDAMKIFDQILATFQFNP